jgi:predicted alternative tryptophan synthase beta-subunit
MSTKKRYNIVADTENQPLPPLNPATKHPLNPEDFYPVFAKSLIAQGLNGTDAWIERPEEIRGMYRRWRPKPPNFRRAGNHVREKTYICRIKNELCDEKGCQHQIFNS